MKYFKLFKIHIPLLWPSTATRFSKILIPQVLVIDEEPGENREELQKKEEPN
jgi:hypothetical protein